MVPSGPDDFDKPRPQGVDRQPRVQRDERARIPARDFDQPGIVDLLMAERAGVNRGVIRAG